MPYQSFFSAKTNAAPVKEKTGKSGYQSIFGGPTIQQASDSDIAAQRQQQATDQAKQRQQQQEQQRQQTQQKQQTSLLGKVKTAGKAIVDDAKTVGSKVINTTAAGTAGVVGLATAGVQAAGGNKAGAKRTLSATNQEENQFLDKGVGGKGAYISSKQADTAGGGKKGYINTFIKPVAQGASDIAPYAVPGVGGESLLAKVGRSAVGNASVAAGTNMANQALNGQFDKAHSGDTVKAAVTGGIFGAAGPLLHGAGKAGKEAISTKGAQETLNNAKTNTVLNQAETANRKDNIATHAGSSAVKEAGKQHIPIVTATESKAGTSLLGKVSYTGANTEKIPVTGKSSVTKGKVKTTDEATYNRESVKLSKSYNKEIAALKDAPPLKQQAMQAEIDSRYSGLQQKLDESAGKTEVNFNGPTRTPRELAQPKPAAEAPKPVVNTIPVAVLKDAEAKRAALPTATHEQPTINNETPPKAEVLPSEMIPERGTSKVAANVQEQAVARGLKKDFGEAGGYDKVTIADQAAKAVKVTNDPQLLNDILEGKKPLPDGLRATALIKAVEEHPVLGKDHNVIRRLSQAEHLTGESSRSAQELRLAAERYHHSPVEAIRQVRKAREAAIEKKSGKTIAKATGSEVQAIRAAKKTVPKPTKESFQSFVESLKC